MKPYLIKRFGYIETCLLWGGGVTAAEVAETFGLQRLAAYQTLRQYRQLYPGNMRVDRSGKRHVAGLHFEPRHVREGADAFLEYVRGENLVKRYLEADDDWSEIPVTDVDRHTRPRVGEEEVDAVIGALRRRETVCISYQSKQRASERVISPNHIVFAGNRYHLRAYCHSSHAYLDFVLTRVLAASPSTAEWVSDVADSEWHTLLNLEFAPNPDLPADVQEAIRWDYRLGPGESLVVERSRAALKRYILRTFEAVDPDYGSARWIFVAVRPAAR